MTQGRRHQSVGVASREGLLRVALVLLTLVPPAARAHPVLTLEVTEHSVSITPGGKPAPPDATFPLTVTLGHTYLGFEHHGLRFIEDFATGRAYALDLAAHTYEDTSLYANVGFRVHELDNRLQLGRMLAGVKLDMPNFAPAIVENGLAVEAPGPKTAIESVTRGAERSFRSRGRELLTLGRVALPLPKDYAGEYWRFLRYYTGGHPEIFRELAGYDGVPRELRIHVVDAYEVTRTLRATGIELRADENYSLAGFAPAGASTEPGKTLARLAAEGPAAVAAAVAATRTERDAFLAEGQVFNAFLRHLAIVIESGDGNADWVVANRARVQADPDALRLIAALKPASASEAEQAVKTLEELRGVDPAGRYLLDVFLANDLAKLGRGSARVERMLAALRINPFLTGAWIDLGGMYDADFEPVLAWACWDAARRLAPSHPFLKVPDELARRLRAEHPEFF